MTWRALLVQTGRDLIALPRRVAEIHEQLESFMTDVSPILTDLAEKIRALGPTVTALVAENAQLREQNAGLAAEDGAESSAAADAVAAYNEVAGVITGEPSAPDVDPLPAPEQPVDPTV